MNKTVEKEIEIILGETVSTDGYEKIEALERLMNIADKDDLPILISAIQSDRNDFFTRELLSQPISILGGVSSLSILFDALRKGEDEGHDNDGLCAWIMEIASANPTLCKTHLLQLLESPTFSNKDYAEWLIEFCEP